MLEMFLNWVLAQGVVIQMAVLVVASALGVGIVSGLSFLKGIGKSAPSGKRVRPGTGWRKNIYGEWVKED